MPIRGMRGEVAVVQHVNVGDALSAGAVSGIVGGSLMLIFAMGAAVLNGMDILSPLRMVGATFVGAGALEGGPGVIVYGLLLHTMTAAAWGVLFAAILPRAASPGATLVAGFGYALLVMLVMLYLVLPIANPVMREGVDGSTAFSIEHLIFGGSLALAPMLRRRYPR